VTKASGAIVLLCGAILSSCATTPAARDYCVAFHPIYISKTDVLSDGTEKQVLAANETWAKLCRK